MKGKIWLTLFIFLFMSYSFADTAATVVPMLPTGSAATKEIALTIDDLPFVGSGDHNNGKLQRKHDRFMQILNTLKERQIPATGFIIAGSIEKGQWELLEAFRDAGLSLGNHTYTHRSLSTMSADKYIEEIAKADKKLSPVMTEPKYFRYPYLAEGTGEKRKKVQDFLISMNYLIAPVTIDSKDYRFNEQLYRIAYRSRPAHLPGLIKRYINYIWAQTQRAEKQSSTNGNAPVKQILLIHANLLNSHAIGDIIDLYQKNGYRFVPLSDVIPPTSAPIQSLHRMEEQRFVWLGLD